MSKEQKKKDRKEPKPKEVACGCFVLIVIVIVIWALVSDSGKDGKEPSKEQVASTEVDCEALKETCAGEIRVSVTTGECTCVSEENEEVAEDRRETVLEATLSSTRYKLEDLVVYQLGVLNGFKQADALGEEFSRQLEQDDLYGAYNTADKAYWEYGKVFSGLSNMGSSSEYKIPTEMKEAHEHFKNCALFRQSAYRNFVKAMDNNGKPKFVKACQDDADRAFAYLSEASAIVTTEISRQEERVRELEEKLSELKSERR